MRVLVFGEILWDVIQGEEFLGGAPFNFAAHITQSGNTAYLISRLGEDDRGAKAFAHCARLSVNQDFIQWDDQRPTGVVNVKLKDGEPDYTIVTDVAWDHIEFNESLNRIVNEKFDVFYFGSLAQRSEMSAQALKKILKAVSCRHVFYDVNLRKSGDDPKIIMFSLPQCSILKLNHEEVPRVSRILVNKDLSPSEFCDQITAIFPNIKTIVITAAERGCYVYIDGDLKHILGVPVKVVDAIGAGDSFSASFMHLYWRTNDAVKAATIANRVGAFVATQRGAIPTYSDEIRRLLQI